MGCCGRYTKMPSLTQQAKNLILSTANVLAHAALTGKIKADPQVVGIRVDLCNKCRYLENGSRCTVCGCFIGMKAGLQVESCPMRKW
jgi:hypothetical protein